MRDCYAAHAAHFLIEVLRVIAHHVARGDAGDIPDRIPTQCVALLITHDERSDRSRAVSKEDVAVPVGLRHAALVPEDARIGPRHVVHVGHFLRIPPPIVVGPALVVGGSSEVHRRSIDHVAVELLQVPVVAAATVPAELGVAVKVASDDLHGTPSNGCAVFPNRVQVGSLVRVPRLDFDVIQFESNQARGRRGPGRFDPTGPSLPANRPVSIGGRAVVGGPGHPQAAVRGVGKANTSARSTETVRNRRSRGPRRAIESGQPVFPVAPSAGPLPAVPNQSLGSHPHVALGIHEHMRMVGPLRSALALGKHLLQRLGAGLQSSACVNCDVHLAIGSDDNSRLPRPDVETCVLAPIGTAGFPSDPDAILAIDRNGGLDLVAAAGCDRNFRDSDRTVSHTRQEYVVVAIRIAVIGNPDRPARIKRHRGLPVICGTTGDLDRGRPSIPARVRLEVDVRMPAAESLPRQRQLAPAIADHARVDVRQRVVG